MIVQIAREDGRDAVFDVPPSMKDQAPADPVIEVALTMDPAVAATGRVREVSPRADPVTGTFRVRVGLDDPPPAMRLGSTVTGRMQLGGGAGIEMPASALTRAQAQPAVWVVDPATQTVSLRPIEVLRFDPARVLVGQGLETGDIVVTAGVQALRPGQKVRLLGSERGAMIGPNLSDVAVSRRSLIVYFMIAGGRGRDASPSSGSAATRTRPSPSAPWSCWPRWPGATLEETLLQVTERIERKLQEVPNLDTLRSYTVPGRPTIFVDLKDSTPAGEVPDIWYQVRKNIGDIRHTLPQGVVGPGFNDDFGDTFGIIYGFTADGFTHRELRDYVEEVRSRLLLVPDVSKIEILGAQDEQIFLEFSTERLAGLGLDYPALIAALQAQNLVRPAGVIQTGDERLSLRVSGAFDSERGHPARSTSSPAAGMVRLGDIAEVRRGYRRPAAADVPRQRQARHRPRRSRCATAATSWRSAATSGGEMAAITADLPIGIEPILVADQARDRRPRHRRVHGIAVAGDPDHHRRQLRQPRRAARLGGGAVDPADARHRLPAHAALRHRPAAHLARRADHRADPAGRRRDDHGRRDDPPAGRRRHQGAGGDLRLPHAGRADADRARSSPSPASSRSASRAARAGEYTFSIFAVVGIALIVSWFVAVLFAPLIGMAILKPPKAQARPRREAGR